MGGGLASLAAAVAAFLASHTLVSLPALRRPLEAVLGRVGFALAYSALSLLLLGWIVVAFQAAPDIEIWPQQAWMRWVPPLAMPWVCVLLVAGLTMPNPFSVGRGGRGFDPSRPGILRLTRHPVVLSLALWSGAHILPNGDAGGLLVFAPFLALSLAGPRLLDAKRRHSLGPAEWARLAAATARPSAWRAMLRETGPARLAGGAALYLALLALHPLVIGLSPLP